MVELASKADAKAIAIDALGRLAQRLEERQKKRGE